jgi:hypothetical protein
VRNQADFWGIWDEEIWKFGNLKIWEGVIGAEVMSDVNQLPCALARG